MDQLPVNPSPEAEVLAAQEVQQQRLNPVVAGILAVEHALVRAEEWRRNGIERRSAWLDAYNERLEAKRLAADRDIEEKHGLIRLEWAVMKGRAPETELWGAQNTYHLRKSKELAARAQAITQDRPFLHSLRLRAVERRRANHEQKSRTAAGKLLRMM